MKKLRLKSWVKDALAIMLFYSIIVFGIIALNARFKYLNQQKSTAEYSYQPAVQMSR